MSGYTIRLTGDAQRDHAVRLIRAAPDYAVVTVKAGDRTPDQNALLWLTLSKISKAKPQGRKHTPEVWKALFMHACGHAVQFEVGLSGEPFPVGFRSSKLSKTQFADLIDFIYAWCSENGVYLDDRESRNMEAHK